MLGQKAKLFSILGVALLLSLASYNLVQRYVAEQTSKEIKQHQEQFVNVLVSRRSIVAGDIIEASVLAKRSYPQNLVQDSWLRPEDAELVIGLAAARYIEKGEPLSPDTLVPTVNTAFSQKLRIDHVAVTSMISKPQLHNGLIEIGDKVTLVSASVNTQKSSLVLSNIEVLALDNYTDAQQVDLSPRDYLPSTVTFSLTSEQALIFEQMRRQSFAVWLQHPDAQMHQVKQPQPIAIHIFKGDKEVEHAFNF